MRDVDVLVLELELQRARKHLTVYGDLPRDLTPEARHVLHDEPSLQRF